ncbi:hypothetical protein D5S17_12380 [Pseudonocardiaceae bacterium YIM PH 21723]|nr:hypothetical protein D5S17_12380 [Pseudonocardiaceae bacterium YIM PH 21723]
MTNRWWPVDEGTVVNTTTPRARHLLVAATVLAFLIAFGLPVVIAVWTLTGATRGLSWATPEFQIGFNLVAVLVAVGLFFLFRQLGAPLTVVTAGKRGLRTAAFLAGIWLLSQLLAAPISLLIDALVTSPGGGGHDSTSAMGVLNGISWALAAGFGEEIIVNAGVVRSLELINAPTWAIYLVAIVARLSFHVYYGWATLEKVLWAGLTVWGYRRARMLWPLVAIHTVHDISVAVPSPPLSVGLTVVKTALILFVVVSVLRRPSP